MPSRGGAHVRSGGASPAANRWKGALRPIGLGGFRVKEFKGFIVGALGLRVLGLQGIADQSLLGQRTRQKTVLEETPRRQQRWANKLMAALLISTLLR